MFPLNLIVSVQNVCFHSTRQSSRPQTRGFLNKLYLTWRICVRKWCNWVFLSTFSPQSERSRSFCVFMWKYFTCRLECFCRVCVCLYSLTRCFARGRNWRTQDISSCRHRCICFCQNIIRANLISWENLKGEFVVLDGSHKLICVIKCEAGSRLRRRVHCLMIRKYASVVAY